MASVADDHPMGTASSWPTKPLRRYIRITSGQSPSKYHFGTVGTPYFKVEQLGRTQKYLSRETTPYLSTDVPSVPAGSVVFAKRGAAIALNRVRLLAEPGFMDTNLMALTPTGDLDAEFLLYALSHRGLWDIADVTSVPQINNKHINPLELPLPSLGEQRAIAGVLAEADALIALLETLIAKKSDIRQGLPQQLLTGRTRLPGYSAPWETAQLSQIGSCLRGVGYDPDRDLNAGDRPFTARLLRANNVQNGAIDLTDLQFVHERRVKPEQFIQAGDIVVCMANGSRALVGKSAYFGGATTHQRYTFGAFMGVFRTRPGSAEPRFVSQVLTAKAFRDWLDVILAGSTINNLRPADVEAFEALLPSLSEQMAIAEVLEDADSELDVLHDRLEKANAIKRGMMQELLSGETRLPAEVIEAYA